MSNHNGFLGPQSMWLGLAVLAAALIGWRTLTPPPDASKVPVAVRSVGVGAESRLEQITKSDCIAREGRLWAVLDDGVECMSYVASPKAESAEVVLVYFGGDVPGNRLDTETQDGARQSSQQRANGWASRHGVPVVIVGRPGLMGSSGTHQLGGRRDEGYVIDATLEALKEKLSVRRLALAGQSGGARIIAQLMAIGRRDIACASMGSGAYDVPRLKGGGTSRTNIFGDPGRRYLVPLLKAGDIPSQSSRRSYVIGDVRDTISPFTEQKAWADKLATLGHHVQLIEATASGPDHHGMSTQAVTAAALCAQGKADPEIRTAVVGK